MIDTFIAILTSDLFIEHIFFLDSCQGLLKGTIFNAEVEFLDDEGASVFDRIQFDVPTLDNDKLHESQITLWGSCFNFIMTFLRFSCNYLHICRMRAVVEVQWWMVTREVLFAPVRSRELMKTRIQSIKLYTVNL